ncbi:protein-export chaperone SecB [Sulfuriflexus sp.]|uniref:protein-export chaperone SecB n=1 Tax=Sulfuriflexus sp. TaxID=2015443 RepID=UPI0028CF2DF3|nr:protein-export chaperone SecB [Sulfuriflexus sp.]MDT8404421.1 protein-export chaperone SecB [Sulfuriflexus sp.]
MSEENTSTTPEQVFVIQKVYTKDISFETPNTPEVFRNDDWQPNINLQLQSRSKPLDENVFEIVLMVTVTAKVDEETTAYLAEVQQAGIFRIDGFGDEEMRYMLGSYCSNILFPFAREVISDLVTRGGFPQLLLAPVNFDALFSQQQEQAAASNETLQ